METNYRKEINLFENTINSLDLSIFILDNSKPPVILECNNAVKETFGYKKKQILGKKTNFLHVNDKYLKKFQNKLYHKSDRSDHIKIANFKMKRKNGEVFPTKHNISIRRDLEGDQIGWVSVVEDLTEKKHIEQELEESEEKFRKISEKASDGIFLIDDEGIVLYWNKAAERIYGYNKEIAMNNYLYRLIMPKEDYQYFENVLKSFRKNKNVPNLGKPIEYEAIRRNGEKIPIEVSYSALELNGNWTLLGIVRDRSEIKKHLRIIKEQNKRLNEIDKYRTELIKRVSHELKTPLISIRGFADLLIDLYSTEFDSNVINLVEEIKNGCYRLENLIKDLLASSKLESGNVKLKKKKEDLSFLIRYCVKELEHLAAKRDQEIILNLDNDLICYIEKERMFEAITNLLSNAIKYSPPVNEIKIKATKKKQSIIVSVEDKGIGFEEAEKEKLFQQFGKIKRRGQDWDVENNGTGLGLYITKQIIELHEGKIWVESEGRNKGSTFYFSVPSFTG